MAYKFFELHFMFDGFCGSCDIVGVECESEADLCVFIFTVNACS